MTKIEEPESKQAKAERLKREEVALRASIQNFRAAGRLSRDAAHERDASFLKMVNESFTDWSDPEAERAFRDF